MSVKASSLLNVGYLYSRHRLKKLLSTNDATINTGIFRPAGFGSVCIFVTENKTLDRTQYVDHLEGDDLHFEGQTQGRTDDLIDYHKNSGLELLVFHRNRKDEHPEYAFRYEGIFEKFDSDREKIPTRFHLRRQANMLVESTSLAPVQSIGDLRANVRRFVRDLAVATERSRSLFRSTTYWVYDADEDSFAASKFVGYKGMTFANYELALQGRSTGSPFDGASRDRQ